MPTTHAHLVGVAGCGMRSLAQVLLAWGWRLSGSDRSAGPAHFLRAAGARIYEGHAAGQVDQRTALVVYSDAVAQDNPELCRAAELGIPAVSFFQMLGRMMAEHRGIAVAGTHGKSTTAAMLADLLVHAGLDPTVIFGATPLGRASGGRLGQGPWMLVEACEYRANFLHLEPEQAVILGIEPDHFDCFDTVEELQQAFAQFAAKVRPGGVLLAPEDCPAARSARVAARCRVETFGLGPAADWSAQEVTGRRGRFGFRLVRRGRSLGRVELRVPGRHNVLNALVAAALAWHHGLPPHEIAAGLGRFGGLHRRLELLGTWRGVTLVDDYAHHPTEVAAGLDTLRRLFPGRRLWCVFQPHQASRTRRLLDELAYSLQNADRVVVAEIYRAREPAAQPGEVTAADLAQRARDYGAQVAAVHTMLEITRLLEAALQPGDVLVTMGAGDIRKIADGFIDRFREDRAAG